MADEDYEELHLVIEGFLNRLHPLAPVAYRGLRRWIERAAERREMTVDEYLASGVVELRKRNREATADFVEYLQYLESLPLTTSLLQTVYPLEVVGQHTCAAWRFRKRAQARDSQLLLAI